ncbi:MAG TPA: 5-oxoprolinase subunit PxpA [Solirubrobacteraceae bacterium]|nr:5-oxoprolinase subunit PxpA [Solirubrobacteraceae bacterium]
MPGPRTIDLNSDLGEGYGVWRLADDSALLGMITSANVACGFHAGDPTTMRKAVTAAAANGVAVGAHVSFPDRRGFGRRDMAIPPREVTDDVVYQVGALDAVARAHGTRVTFVKPHGALYNRMAVDRTLADAVVEALASLGGSLPLVTLPGSEAAIAARAAGVTAIAEAFADRAYDREGRLVSRDRPGAVISDPEEVTARAVRMATEHAVETIDGEVIKLEAQTLCVHGDSPGSVALATAIRAGLESAGFALAPFAG